LVTLSRILIANRGEIALRIVRTARDLGATSILPYTPEDLMSPAAELADEAYALPEGSSYTDAAALLELARATGADAIHPGYGFLSEDADFARSIIEAGITWVGPSPEAMDALGDKMSARATAERAQVAPVPGITDSVTDAETVIAFAAAHGYPVALKRTDGGGGRGITVLHNDDEVRATPAFESAAQGGGTLILERFVTAARHVETQCARDSHGGFAVVSTRDCSLQRRNQKLLEEAPAPFLPEGVHGRLVEASRRLLETVDYVGVATCEFLLTPEGDIWFLEVNPRLQVEHCVTEEVAGTDLVEIQLRIAEGGHLGQVNEPRGHSLELRITCEDPARGLAPSTGTITRLRWPAGPGIRIESGVTEGDVVTPLFDPMLAKIIVTGASREQAIARAALARLAPKPGTTLLIDAGTTTGSLARLLPGDTDLTVITNSVLTAACLAAAGRTRVRILGGQLRGLTQAAVGPEAVEALSTLRVDVAVLGANGLSAAHGLSTPDPDEATVKRAMVRSARQVVALVDSTKIGQEHLVSFASLDDIDLLVTDVELPPALIDQLTATETEVLVA